MRLFIPGLRLILGVLLSRCWRASSSPIISITKVGTFPPVLLSSGVIINERFILTTQHPIFIYPYHLLAVLTSTMLASLQKSVVQQSSYEIIRVYYPVRSNRCPLAVLMVHEDIDFHYGVSPAMFPFRKFTFVHAHDCQEYIFLMDRKRKDGFRLVDSLAMTKEARKKLRVHGFHRKGIMDQTRFFHLSQDLPWWEPEYKVPVLCPTFNGLPFVCKHKILGLLNFTPSNCKESQVLGFTIECATLCDQALNVTYVSLLSPWSQDFLTKFIPGAPAYRHPMKWEDGSGRST